MRYPVVYFEMLLVGFLLIFGHSMLRAFLPLFARELDPTSIFVGFTISSYFFARSFIELPSGFISDRIGRRTPIIVGLCLGLIGSLICSFSTSIYMLILGFTLWGLGAALFFTSNTAFIINMFEPHVRGRALGTFQGLEFIGSFAGAPMGGFLAVYLGYTSVFYATVVSISFGFLIAFMSTGLRQDDTQTKKRPTHMSAMESLNGIKNWCLLTTCIASFLRMFVSQGVISTILPIYLYDFLNMSAGIIGIVIGMRTAGICVATATCGHISDRVGRKPIIFAGILIESLCIYLYTLVGSFELLILLGFIEGLGAGMISCTLVVLMSEQVAHKYLGGAVGLYRTFMDVGAVAGPILIMMVQMLFGIPACFFLGVVLLLANIPTLSTAKERNITK